MPIDTSSYYPEVNDPDGNNGDSLNNRHSSLFGDKPKEEIIEVVLEEENNRQPGEPRYEEPQAQPEGWEKPLTLFCNFLSWVLVPLLMPVFGTIFIFRLSILDVVPSGLQTAFIFIILGLNFVLPVLLVLLLKFLGLVDDIGLNGQKERLIPYMITVLCMGGSAWFMATRGAPIWVCMFFAGGAAAGLINLLINLKWKISAHAAGIAGVIALLIRLQKDVAAEPQLFVWLLITVGAAGLLGSARVWLQRHTVWQVLAGYVVGFCSVFFMMSIH